MKIEKADKMKGFEAGIFTILNEKKMEVERTGRKIYNFSIGTPDFEPFPHIMKTVSDACLKPENYKYSITDMEELVEAVQYRYHKRYGVDLQKDEIMSIYGSQEGMTHILQPLINPGDIVLLPNPGYPIFSMGAYLAQADQWYYPLTPDKDYLPDFEAIPEEIKKSAKVMVVSYPANPLCVTAPDSFYEELTCMMEDRENLSSRSPELRKWE